MSFKTKVVIFLIILGMVSGSALWARKLMLERARAERAAEAAIAERKGLIVAQQHSQQALTHALGDASLLRDQIKKLRKVVPTAKPTEVIRWRTKEIVVPGERIFVPGETVYVEGDCEIQAQPELPAIRFGIRGTEARLASAGGNTFAIGTVELLKLPDEEVLGQSDWQADLTDLLALEEAYSTGRLFQVYLGLSTSPSVRLGASWTRPARRLGYWVMADRNFDSPPERCFEQRGDYGSSVSCFSQEFDNWTVAGGAMLTWGR